MKIIKDKEEGYKLTYKSSGATFLENIKYLDLVQVLGEPLYTPEDSGDGKVNFEWVILFKNKVFTIYDWKTYDKNYSMYELDIWNVGSKNTSFAEVQDFVEYITNKVKNSNLVSINS